MTNILKFPLDRLPNVKAEEVFAGVRALRWNERTVQYIINSKFRQSVRVKDWLAAWYNNTSLEVPNFGEPSDAVALKCLSWVRKNVKYSGDLVAWKMDEYWATPDETLAKGSGDCDDGSALLYYILKKHGFSDDQVHIVAGDCLLGGHCYVTYFSFKDAVEYTLDWCYSPYDSLIVPYGNNPAYLRGEREWFRFNVSGSYKRYR